MEDGEILSGAIRDLFDLIITFLITGTIAGCLIGATKIPEVIRSDNENKSTITRDFYGYEDRPTNDKEGMEQYDGLISAEEAECEAREYIIGNSVSVYVNGRLINNKTVGNNIPLGTYLMEYENNALFSSVTGRVFILGERYSRTYGTDANGKITYVIYELEY